MVFTTLIPTHRNDGSAVSDAEMRDILGGLWRQFGGATIEGIVEGHWIDAGKHYQDRSLKVSVACEANQLQEAEAAVLAIGRRLGQLAMYFEVRYFDGVRFLKVD